MRPPPPLLEMRDIVVRFGTLLANDHISIEIREGEVHALLGENGAGKTTLMRALIGLTHVQSGQIFLRGKKVEIRSAKIATDLGIGMVHQHFMLIPTLTVAQNVCIGLPSAGFPFPNLERVSEEIRHMARLHHLQVDPGAKVAQLSVGAQQRVEIIKALYRGAKVLILDEPTSVLTPQETSGLFDVIRSLATQGNAIVFISHKLREVMEISQHITVLRHGKIVATRDTRATNPAELAQLMVGHDVGVAQTSAFESQVAPIVAKVENLTYTDDRNVSVLRGINLAVRKGEIHGIAGVDGNGQDELAKALSGLVDPTGGKIWLDDVDITHASPAHRIQAGLAHIPGDRQNTGLVLDLSIADNAVIETISQRPYSYMYFLNYHAINHLAENLIAAYDIRCQDTHQIVGTLSGGNQQKLVLAREMFRNPRFIIAMHPTRGLDIGATEYVRSMLIAQTQRGCAILLISTELEEILALSHQISVIYEGRIMDTLPRESVRIEEIGLLMAGKTL